MKAGGTDNTAQVSDQPEMNNSDVDETSVFIPKEVLGGKTFQPGDSLTLTIKDVDPDTGEVEAVYGSTSATTQTKGFNEAFNAKFPDEEE